jgi:hypothetical protein
MIDVLQDLVKEWKEQAKHQPYRTEWEEGIAFGREECADELQRVINEMGADPKAGSGGPMVVRRI